MRNQRVREGQGDELLAFFIASNPSDGYLSEFLVGLLSQTGLNNVQLFVGKREAGGHEQDQARHLIANGLDGVILPPPLCDSEAACRMTRHLVTLSHQRIGFVVGHPNQTASARRLAGYRAALEEKGADKSEELVVQGMFTYRSGLDAAEHLLSLDDRPTAVFASNDDMATATVAVAHRLGLDVPGDLTVTGFDDTALATIIWPELTTVRQPTAEMAREAVQSLVRRHVGRGQAGTRRLVRQRRVELLHCRSACTGA